VVSRKEEEKGGSEPEDRLPDSPGVYRKKKKNIYSQSSSKETGGNGESGRERRKRDATRISEEEKESFPLR